MTTDLTFSLPEICLFLSSAVIFGVTIGHFTAHRKQKKTVQENDPATGNTEIIDQSAINDPEIISLQDQLRLSVEKVNLLATESEELRWLHRRFEVHKDELEKKIKDLNKKNNLRLLAIQDKPRIAANA